jgi:hypothetical protein
VTPASITLLDLDGQVLVVDPDGKHWVKFSVKRVDPTRDRPHGLSYSLTLHTESGERLVWACCGPDRMGVVESEVARQSLRLRRRRDFAGRLLGRGGRSA